MYNHSTLTNSIWKTWYTAKSVLFGTGYTFYSTQILYNVLPVPACTDLAVYLGLPSYSCSVFNEKENK